MDEYIIDIIAANGVPFRAVYGYREYRDGSLSKTPVMTFYDRRSQEFDMHGQFVADYDSDTFLSHGSYALDLYGPVASWILDFHSVSLIQTWLARILLAK